MATLFEGKPQVATSYVKDSSQSPQWMQDAIYNQIQWAQNIANMPYQQYTLPTVAELSPAQQRAYANVVSNQGAWSPSIQQAQAGLYDISKVNTAGGLQQGLSQYSSSPEAVQARLASGQNYLNQAGQMDIMGSAAPYLQQAAQRTGQSSDERAITTANPYLQSSARSAADTVGSYMSPYQQGVLDVIARQGARNLSENLMPRVSDAFIKAGQFGSSRMGEMGSRAIRDTQEAILNQQSQALQQGYGQAMSAAQQDLARQGQLGSTAGSIAGADLSRMLQGASQYGNLAQMQGQLAGQQMSQLSALGQAQTAAGQAQQQFGIGAAQAAQAAQAQDLARQQSALQGIAGLAQQEQGLRTADVAALESVGAAQQAQAQRQLDAARAAHEAQVLYPRQQMDWLSTQIRGMAPITPQSREQSGTTTGATYSPSPLSQLATGYAAYKGLSNL